MLKEAGRNLIYGKALEWKVEGVQRTLYPFSSLGRALVGPPHFLLYAQKATIYLPPYLKRTYILYFIGGVEHNHLTVQVTEVISLEMF